MLKECELHKKFNEIKNLDVQENCHYFYEFHYGLKYALWIYKDKRKKCYYLRGYGFSQKYFYPCTEFKTWYYNYYFSYTFDYVVSKFIEMLKNQFGIDLQLPLKLEK